MAASERMAEAIDLSHHINTKSKARHASPLKDIIKFMSYDGMVSLAGGLPHESLFPVESITFNCFSPDTSLSGTTDTPGNPAGTQMVASGGNLSQFLQYGTGAGNAQLVSLLRELTDRVHSPPYNYECLLHPGNTNAWSKVVGLLCEDDDFVLCDEYVYPSAQALWIPMGIKAAPVAGDAEGMRADKLAAVLEGWESTGQKGRKPHVLYLVPVGSNPTGVSISAQRRKEIYQLCVAHDIIIIEDDPYYCLQYEAYQPGASGTPGACNALPSSTFVSTLIPSFLSLDYQGRVIRLESFSKTLFPGLRLGFFVANPTFTERLLRATEVETQDPAGLSQLFVLSLLQKWKVDGYLQWLQNLQVQYRIRRNWLVDAIAGNFDLAATTDDATPSARRYTAYVKGRQGEKSRPAFTFVDPTAGMFLWANFYFDGVPRFADIQLAQPTKDAEQLFAAELWKAWTDELVLLTPGSYYHPWQGPDLASTSARGAQAGTAHFRLSFATPTKEQIEVGIQRLRRVVGEYWT